MANQDLSRAAPATPVSITDKAALQRFIEEIVEQLPLNKIQGLAGQLASIDQRLKKGGL